MREKQMDGRPFRAPERRVINGGTDAAARRPEDPRARQESAGAPRNPKPYRIVRDGGWLPRIVTTLIIVIVVVALAVVGWMIWSSQHGNPGIDSSKYQAVAMSDGTNYFGKLTVVNSDYLKLSDVYYLKPQATSTDGTDTTDQSATNNFSLVNFKDVVYGPEDEIIIQKSQILFYENLDPNGKVAQAIAQAGAK
jgi:hypothetical protein